MSLIDLAKEWKEYRKHSSWKTQIDNPGLAALEFLDYLVTKYLP